MSLRSTCLASSLLGLAYVWIAAASAHFSRPDLGAVNVISQYAVGPRSYWMSSALWSWSLSAMLLSAAVSLTLPRATIRIVGLLGLFTFSIAVGAVASVPIDFPWPVPDGFSPEKLTIQGRVHLGGASLAAIFFPPAALLLSWHFGRSHDWSDVYVWLFRLALGCLVSTVIAFVIFETQEVVFGVAQRVFVVFDLAWMTNLAVVLPFSATGPAQIDDSGVAALPV